MATLILTLGGSPRPWTLRVVDGDTVRMTILLGFCVKKWTAKETEKFVGKYRITS
jgi:hypothetical protein